MIREKITNLNIEFFFKYYSIQKHVCDVTDWPDSLKQVAILIKRTPIKLLRRRRTDIAGNMTAGSRRCDVIVETLRETSL